MAERARALKREIPRIGVTKLLFEKPDDLLGVRIGHRGTLRHRGLCRLRRLLWQHEGLSLRRRSLLVEDRGRLRAAVQRKQGETETAHEEHHGEYRCGTGQGIRGTTRTEKTPKTGAAASHAKRAALRLLQQDNSDQRDRNNQLNDNQKALHAEFCRRGWRALHILRRRPSRNPIACQQAGMQYYGPYTAIASPGKKEEVPHPAPLFAAPGWLST